MDYHKILCEAIDHLADDKELEAKTLIHQCIQDLKKTLPDEKQLQISHIPNLYHWANCLELLDEWELSILKYESILKVNPNEEEALYKICQILFFQLEKPEIAIHLLQKKLLPLNSEKKEYRDLEANVLALLKHLHPNTKKDEEE